MHKKYNINCINSDWSWSLESSSGHSYTLVEHFFFVVHINSYVNFLFFLPIPKHGIETIHIQENVNLFIAILFYFIYSCIEKLLFSTFNRVEVEEYKLEEAIRYRRCRSITFGVGRWRINFYILYNYYSRDFKSHSGTVYWISIGRRWAQNF